MKTGLLFNHVEDEDHHHLLQAPGLLLHDLDVADHQESFNTNSESPDLGGPSVAGDIVCPRQPCLRYTPYLHEVQYQALNMYSTTSTHELCNNLVVYKPYVDQ